MSTTTVVCIALLGILLFLLGANVTRNRALRGGGDTLRRLGGDGFRIRDNLDLKLGGIAADHDDQKV